MLKLVQRLLLILFVGISAMNVVGAQQDVDFAIIPEADSQDAVMKDVIDVASDAGHVWDNYDEIAHSDRKLGHKLASGILNRDDLLDYVVYLIKFISQIGLLVGACMFIYAGYMYATDIMGGDPSTGKKAIKNAIIGIVVLSFSYAIMKILTNMFIE